MDDNRQDVQAVKERFNDFREREKEIEYQAEAIEVLNNKLTGLGAMEITDMPRSPSPPKDRLTDLVNRKIELEEELKSIIEEQAAERKAIIKLLKKLKSADERGVIKFRYLLCLEWYDVNFSMFGAKEDFDEKEESYLRRVYNIHGRALINIATYLESQKH